MPRQKEKCVWIMYPSKSINMQSTVVGLSIWWNWQMQSIHGLAIHSPESNKSSRWGFDGFGTHGHMLYSLGCTVVYWIHNQAKPGGGFWWGCKVKLPITMFQERLYISLGSSINIFFWSHYSLGCKIKLWFSTPSLYCNKPWSDPF